MVCNYMILKSPILEEASESEHLIHCENEKLLNYL